MNFTNSVSYYAGGSITCYPSSNAQDEGKLNLEYNMARLVTRVTSKNFCIVNPSFVMELVQGQSGPQIKVSPGQASINGMDIIATDYIYLDPPNNAGTFYVYFQLCRDSSWNVKGDTTVGVVVTFDGLALTYGTDKLENDPDKFYLGSVNWNGTAFNNLQEDEDKYGRIWASDILSKVNDPKHPDYTRLNLQEYIYKLPDWYMSKEGDIMYGPLILADNRTDNNSGVIMNVDSSGSHVTIKEPSTDNNKLLFYGDINGDGLINSSDVTLVTKYINGTGTLTDAQKARADINHDGVVDAKDLQLIKNYVNQVEDAPTGDVGNIYYIINTDKGINIDITKNAQNKETDRIEIGPSSIEASETDNILKIKGKAGVEVSTGVATDPKLLLASDGFAMTDPQGTGHTIGFNITQAQGETKPTSTFTLGKAIWKYTEADSTVSLLNTNVSYLSIAPETKLGNNTHLASSKTLYFGSTGTATNNYINATNLHYEGTSDSQAVSLTANASKITIVQKAGTNSSYIYLGTQNDSDLTRSIMYASGRLILQNNRVSAADTGYPCIEFRDASNTATITKVKGSQVLKITGGIQTTTTLSVGTNATIAGTLSVTGTSTLTGDVSAVGKLTVTGKANLNGGLAVTGAATFSSTVTASGAIQGTKLTSTGGQLVLGNVTITGTTTGSKKITTATDVEITGTLTATKVYNAVYNGIGEIFRKDKDEVIEFGDIVCVREDGLVHKVSSYTDLNTIIGICSNTIGVELGGNNIPEEEQVEVEMLGQIWVKTDNETIHPGQLVKALSNGKCDVTDNVSEKLGVVIKGYVEGKVRIVYTG